MSDYYVSKISGSDSRAMAQVDALLKKEGIKRDGNLDYTCAVYDSDYNVIATGSAFGNTLRCFAVSSEHQGEGLMNIMMSHLLEHEMSLGFSHVFVYTKTTAAKFFLDMGFYEIARIQGSFVFLENRRNGFKNYLLDLAEKAYPDGVSGAVVMNANPFTKGHLYLVEKAASQCDHLHIFVVSEDKSVFPYKVRRMIVEKGTEALKNVSIHESGPYIISSATFPSYFLKDETDVMKKHALLDATVFTQIAKAMNIRIRFVGDEPFSAVTSVYNSVLSEELPKAGIELEVIPRVEYNSKPISASDVRLAVKNEDWSFLENVLPPSTVSYLKSPEALCVIEAIKAQKNVVHH